MVGHRKQAFVYWHHCGNSPQIYRGQGQTKSLFPDPAPPSPVPTYQTADGGCQGAASDKQSFLRFEMPRNKSVAVRSCGNAGHMETRSDFLQLQKLLHDNQKVIEERFQTMDVRFAQMEKRHSQERGRISKLEESVRRAVDGVMPKVEELLARHDTPQPLREVDPRLVPVGAS
ncbi:Protein of unknown function, partial [Gryllus bimaculatus]